MPFFCPLCPSAVSFDNEHSLKVHVSSAQHIDSHPYECRVCHGRFATRQEARQHHNDSHRDQPFAPIVHYEEGPKRLQVHLIVKYAREVAQENVRPLLDDLTAMESIAGGLPAHQQRPNSTAGLDPTPDSVFSVRTIKLDPVEVMEGSLFEASEQGENQTGPANDAGSSANGPVENSTGAGGPANDDGGCAKCGEEVVDTYSARRQHVFEAHPAGLEGARVKPKQAKLKAVMGECFPQARVLNDLTCNRCDEELITTGRVKDFTKLQLSHIERSHLEEDMGVRLSCPVDGCPDRNVAKPTGLALLRHIQQVHGSVDGLDHVSRTGYKARRMEAKQQLARNKTRYFPYSPHVGLPAAHRQRRNTQNQ